jgi:chromosome segregation ATPase
MDFDERVRRIVNEETRDLYRLFMDGPHLPPESVKPEKVNLIPLLNLEVGILDKVDDIKEELREVSKILTDKENDETKEEQEKQLQKIKDAIKDQLDRLKQDTSPDLHHYIEDFARITDELADDARDIGMNALQIAHWLWQALSQALGHLLDGINQGSRFIVTLNKITERARETELKLSKRILELGNTLIESNNGLLEALRGDLSQLYDAILSVADCCSSAKAMLMSIQDSLDGIQKDVSVIKRDMGGGVTVKTGPGSTDLYQKIVAYFDDPRRSRSL